MAHRNGPTATRPWWCESAAGYPSTPDGRIVDGVELPFLAAAFAVGFALGLLPRAADGSFKWSARILAVAFGLAVLITVVNFVRQGAGSLVPDAGACRVDSEGILIDPDACSEGQTLWHEIYGLTVVGSIFALVAGALISLRLTNARAAKRRAAADPSA